MDRKAVIKSCFIARSMGTDVITLFLESCKKISTGAGAKGPTVNFKLDLSQSANSSSKTADGSLSNQGIVLAYNGFAYFALA